MNSPDPSGTTTRARATTPGTPPMQWFRIANMDCASEEGEIRQALDGMAGIHQLQFRLGARALGIAADAQILPQALAAIRRCGFKPQALPVSAGSAVQAVAGCFRRG